MRGKQLLLAGLVMVGIALVLAACGTNTPTLAVPELVTQAPCPTAGACPNCPTCPAVTETAPETSAVEVPYLEAWQASPHADETAEAFIHWDEEDPKEVPANCAQCHSTPGYQDYVGADGSAVFVVDAPAATGTTVTCVACHNPATAALDEVPFPSGAIVGDLEDESRCMVCHQGRSSAVQVAESIEAAGLTEDVDTVSADLRFINIHYYAAAATLYGSVVHGGFEYADSAYEGRFRHVEQADTCIECHDPHTLELQLDTCATCHTDATSVEAVREIRMPGSLEDYDGDGDVEEGIAAEITGLQEALYSAIQAYATGNDAAIVYDPASHPYWFGDANANSAMDEGEEAYASWTPRLLKAAYNYQVSVKDPGAFAHNAKYIIQLLHDSLADLNTQLGDAAVSTETMARNDAGHFDGTGEAFRHWDEEGLVPADCVKCHTAEGLPVFLEEASASRDLATGRTISFEPSNGLACETCHVDATTFAVRTSDAVKFPSGAVLSFGEGITANICLNCHQGREANQTVKAAINSAKLETPDTIGERLSFRNPHYFAAGATLFGGEAQGAYQYDVEGGYVGRFMHVPGFDTCAGCHDPHELTLNMEACAGCHQGVTTAEEIRLGNSLGVDFDGDGDTTEGVSGEVATLHEALYVALQAYAADTAGAPIMFSPASYPYWFGDANANNTVDEGEAAYASWTPRLLAAAFNYTWVAKDPGAFAHNGDYIMQVLIDSISDLGGDVSAYTRPVTPEAPAATP